MEKLAMTLKKIITNKFKRKLLKEVETTRVSI